MDPLLDISIGIGIGCYVVDYHHSMSEADSHALTPARST